MCQTPGECFIEQYRTADEGLVQALCKSTLELNVCVAVTKLKTCEIKQWIQKPEIKTVYIVEPKPTPLEEINQELNPLSTHSRYPKRERIPHRICSSNCALRRTSREMSYQESGTSENDDTPKTKKTHKPDPSMKEPSLARIAAQKIIDSRPGKTPKNNISPIASSPEYNMHRPPRAKPVDKTRSRTARPANRKPVLKRSHKTTYGFFKIQTKAKVLLKYSRKIIYHCLYPNCTVKRDSLRSLNAHYRVRHPPITCNVCGKLFSTQSTLSKHSYNHRTLNFVCHTCGKAHAFKSQLQNHCLCHKRTKDFACIWPNCGKIYFSKGSLPSM